MIIDEILITIDIFVTDSISKFENVPAEVSLEVENELYNSSFQNYKYAKRSGHATRQHRCDKVDHFIPRDLYFIRK